MFSMSSVGVVPHVDVFLMICEEEPDLHVLLLRHLEGLQNSSVECCDSGVLDSCPREVIYINLRVHNMAHLNFRKSSLKLPLKDNIRKCHSWVSVVFFWEVPEF